MWRKAKRPLTWPKQASKEHDIHEKEKEINEWKYRGRNY